MIELTDLELLEIDGGSCPYDIKDCDGPKNLPSCKLVGDGIYFCPL